MCRKLGVSKMKTDKIFYSIPEPIEICQHEWILLEYLSADGYHMASFQDLRKIDYIMIYRCAKCKSYCERLIKRTIDNG